MDNIEQKADAIFLEIQSIVSREIRCHFDEEIVIAFKSAGFLLNYILLNNFTMEEIELLRDKINYNYSEFEAERDE